jgi:predicted dehydrogenase
MATQAAQARKAIFMEKPMALTEAELDGMAQVLEATGVPFMVGFNRRFSPIARRVRGILANRRNPLMMLYRVNAGYIAPDHWTQTNEGGGRIVGEACHMFDLFRYFVGTSRAVEVSSASLGPGAEHLLTGDNVSVTVRYADGSVGTLFYTALGAVPLAKERVEIYVDGKAIVIDDFRTLHLHGVSTDCLASGSADKGHLEEMKVFAEFVGKGTAWPISLADLTETSRIALSAAGSRGKDQMTFEG